MAHKTPVFKDKSGKYDDKAYQKHYKEQQKTKIMRIGTDVPVKLGEKFKQLIKEDPSNTIASVLLKAIEEYINNRGQT